MDYKFLEYLDQLLGSGIVVEAHHKDGEIGQLVNVSMVNHFQSSEFIFDIIFWDNRLEITAMDTFSHEEIASFRVNGCTFPLVKWVK